MAVPRNLPEPVPLSIILAATHPWPEFGVSLNAVYQEAANLGAEVIVADRTGHALPADWETRFPGVIWLQQPDYSVYQLRALGVKASRGEIVAITEDHCRPAPGWCAGILESHRSHPEAAMIGGGADNGSREGAATWASFLLTNAAAMTPVEGRFQDKSALQINVSYKRPFLPGDCPERGFMEWIHNQELQRRGHQLVADDSLQVDHVQYLSFPRACVVHFHAGRTVAGFRAARLSAFERALWAALCPALPILYYSRAALAALIKRRYIARTAVYTPVMLVLALFRSAGALAGYVASYGTSPLKIV